MKVKSAVHFAIRLMMIAKSALIIAGAISSLAGCVYAGLIPFGVAGDGKGNVSVFVGHGGGALGIGGVGGNCSAACLTSPDSDACKMVMTKAGDVCGKPTSGDK